MFIVRLQHRALTWADNRSPRAEAAASPSNTWNIFHIPIKGANCKSVGGPCKAPLLATAADSALPTAVTVVDSLLTQSPHPASPLDEKWESWSVTLWGREGESVVGLPCFSWYTLL